MGLERLASVIQDVPTNFDTDVFIPIIQKVEDLSGKKYGVSEVDDVSFKVIGDHIRTVAFAIGDGALPSNEGRGYVLRRLIRRATRFGKELGIKQAFLSELVPIVKEVMNDYYPEIAASESFIKQVIHQEEERFLTTLDEGIKIYEDMRDNVKDTTKILSGAEAFKLYDTFGFPIEMTIEYAAEDGITVDIDGFNTEMKKQKDRARSSRKDSNSMNVQSATYSSIKDISVFTGYESVQSEGKLLYIIKDDEKLDSYEGNDFVEVIFDKTPFYAISGGQVADTGIIQNEHAKMEVVAVTKAPNGQNIHTVHVKEGVINIADVFSLEVNKEARNFIIKNHTATHLLHQALKDVIGNHANQAGSLVEKERLRFDFTHIEGLKDRELKQIERIVNEKIYASLAVEIAEMPIEDAKKKGAMALFGEKYGDAVRVVDIDGYSIELCGGIHVGNTGQIGTFKILSESGIGAGVRRIEAVTSKYAVERLQEEEKTVERIANSLKVKKQNVESKIVELERSEKALQIELKELKAAIQKDALSDLSNDTVQIGDYSVIKTEVNVGSVSELRDTMDMIKSSEQNSIIALASIIDDKVSLIVSVPKPLTKDIKAGDIMKGMAERVDGKGGGRPDQAQGGGTNVGNINAALQFVEEYIKSFV